jgi:SPP1 gp7 family putative phage head morphogenesis protein
MADPEALNLPFREAINFFRQKQRVPTDVWTDLWQAEHARGFMVAGATRDALLEDFQTAIARALEEGTTLAQFREDFDAIVARHGWDFVGGRTWRSRVIFDTNLRSAHAAGKWEQIQRLRTARPFLRYVAVQDMRTRPDHAAWHGTILPADDPWWDTHYPSNGWYCRCTVQQLSERDLERRGLTVSAEAPPSPLVAHSVKTPTGRRRVRIPEGIDPGFAFNVGKAAEGQRTGRGNLRPASRR